MTNGKGNIKEKTLGTDVLKGLNPAQSIIKMVNDEMTSLMGNASKEIKLNNSKKQSNKRKRN